MDSERFSYSRLSTFDSCPQAYAFRYVEHIPESFRTIEQHMGATVHGVLEWFYHAKVDDPAITQDDVRREYDAIWQRGIDDDVKVVKRGRCAQDYYDEGLEMLGAYRARSLETDQGATEALELRFEHPLRERVAYVGVIDRVSRLPGGTMRITDYKTGRSVPDPSEDKQLSSYSIFVLDHYDLDRVELCYEDLRNGQTLLATSDHGRADQTKRAILNQIDTVLADTVYEARRSALCSWCGYNDRCGTDAPESSASKICPRCGSRLAERRGRHGRFVGCTGYPSCRYTRDSW